MLMDLGNFSEFCPSREGRNMGRNEELAPGLPCREVRDMQDSVCCYNLYGVPAARRIFVGMRFFYPYVVPMGHVSIIGFFASHPMNSMLRVSITYPLYRYADGSWKFLRFCPSREGRNMGKKDDNVSHTQLCRRYNI